MQYDEQRQQQMYALVSAWQGSGLTQKVYCEQNAVPYHVFHYWYRRLRTQQGDTIAKGGEGFMQVVVSAPAASSSPWCELLLENGRKLCFHQPLPASFIKNLVD
jgi:hypothetical protein